MSEPRPSLRVLGPPALHGPDGEPVPFRVRKHFALLIYLALEPGVHRRDKLGTLLWPKATASEARHSLATALSVLRAKLGRERIETGRDTVHLLPGALEVDLDRLARGEIHATETQSPLPVAPLLHDLVIPDAEPWDHWRDGMVARWQPAIRDALLARIDRARRQGDSRSMEVLADALLLLDDLSEDGVRAKMESRAFAGDRLTALQIYEAWRVRLADELGAQPSDLIAGMALRLRRRGWERTSSEHIPSVRTDQWKDRPFVGRAREYEALYEGWEGCQRGTPRHALIRGASGVGKSTLVERLVTAAGLQGAASARIQCHEVEKEIPYGAIGGLIALLLDKPGASTISPEWLGELGRTVSAVRRRFPNAPPPVEATGETVRIRLVDALHELVRTIAEEQPLILVMDDLHLGDDASVAAMFMLLRRLTDERVLVLCTLRQGEGNLGPSAKGMIDLAEVAQMGVVDLPPLTDAEAGELLGHLLPADTLLPATVRRALLRSANGTPMLLELLVRDWLAHGDRCVALSVQAMTEVPGAEGGAGGTYRRLLERLTTGLDPTTRSVLNLAAILGSQLNEFELYGLVDLTLAQAMTGLSHLATLRILRDGGQGLEFVNEVMRGEVYLAVPSSVRKVLHSKVADQLIQRAQAGEEMLGLAIAWHCMRSSRLQEAGEWLIRGGEEAIERSALAEAEAALESGWKNLLGDAGFQCALMLSLVLVDQARYQDASTLLRELALFPAHGHTERLSELTTLASWGLALHDPATLHHIIPHLLEACHAHPSALFRLRAGTLAGAAASVLGDQTITRQAASALAKALPLAPSQYRARQELHIAQLHFLQRELKECETLLQHLSSSDSRDGPALLQFNRLLGLGACSMSRGDYKQAGVYTEGAVIAARRSGAPSKEVLALANSAIIHFRLGEFALALARATECLTLAGPCWKDTSPFCAQGVALGCLAVAQDQPRMQNALARMRHHLDTTLTPHVRIIAQLWLADGLQLAGDRAAAIDTARSALAHPNEHHLGHAGLVARWAWTSRGVLGDGRTRQLVEYVARHISSLDALDKLEVALIAMRLGLPDPTNTSFAYLANSAEQALPGTAITLSYRLGLPRRD